MISRRAVLRGSASTAVAMAAGIVAAGSGATSASAASAGPRAVPTTLAANRGRLASRTVVTAPKLPLTHLSVAHTGESAAVRLRTAAGWGQWRELGGCAGGRDGSPAAGYRSSVVVAAGATAYEVQAKDGSTVSTVELNTVDGPLRTVAAPVRNALPLPSGATLPFYLSRGTWDADESLRFAADGSEVWPGQFIPVQTLTVHHTGLTEHNGDPDPAATVRAIYYDQCVLQGWGDIGYHLLIDEQGRVYEGRYSGSDAIPVYGSALGDDRRPLMVNAAHVGGFNAGNVGVCLLGRFSTGQPTAAAHRSLVLVLAALSALGRLNPTARTTYVNPLSGVSGEVNVISGHRDWASIGADPTECPGDAFYPYLGKLRREVAALYR
ncbi:N-acetylmuramoyl-L-alanine amidase [Micromonospora pisi]|uniref:N-acetylmuramoyl-L-alanine amidase n=1 Tax=Micromonospora pisi TaxID=589240 RepID=A0A495JIX8_9ACTN|nr:peptidoglycan recognition family protein [Micromonospora pisi]RKR88528.1 N-acetylmuramoyl-L-alanine amidase [Micromonospora pisi]